MKILLDAMYDGLKEYLTEKNHEVISVRDLGKSSANDADVRKYASEHNMILVTQDKRSADVGMRNGVDCVLISLGDIAELVNSKILQNR